MRRRRRTIKSPEITLTPLIDTALTLLIIFMVTAPMMQNSIKVELPQGQAQESKGTPQELVVFIDKKQQLYFDNKKVDMPTLIKNLKTAIGKDTEKTIFVKGDRAVNYGHVINVVDQLKMVGGIKYVAMATQSQAA